jgi:hypothetical protein
MKQKIKLVTLVVFLSMFIACIDDPPPPPTPIGECPDATNTVYWASNPRLGTWWRLGSSGEDGDNGIPTGGAIARNLKTDCGWIIYDNHAGGYGDTYQVIPADTSMRFIWAYNKFHEIELFPKWVGSTEHGAKMGDTLSVFLQKEPGFFITGDSAVYIYTNVVVTVNAEFTDKNPAVGKLKKLHLISLL